MAAVCLLRAPSPQMQQRTGQAKQVVFEVTEQVAGLAEAQLADAP